MTYSFSAPKGLTQLISGACRLPRTVALLTLALLSSPGGAETIDLRFIVDTAAAVTISERMALRRRLRDQVNTLNGYYRSSLINLEARLIDLHFTPIVDHEATRLLDAMLNQAPPFEGLLRRADEVGADYSLVLVRGLTIRGKGRCGRALDIHRSPKALASSRKAFAVLDVACRAHTLAHELGHLMGLNHGAMVDRCQPNHGHTSAITPYANGFGSGNCDGRPQPGEFGTIMVGGWMRAIHGDQHASLPLFSNPLLHDPRCGETGRCGDPLRGDAARVLNENAALYAGHESPDVHTLPFADPRLAACISREHRGVEIAELKALRCRGEGITHLGGLEQLTALREVDLSDNPLSCEAVRRLRETQPTVTLESDPCHP